MPRLWFLWALSWLFFPHNIIADKTAVIAVKPPLITNNNIKINTKTTSKTIIKSGNPSAMVPRTPKASKDSSKSIVRKKMRYSLAIEDSLLRNGFPSEAQIGIVLQEVSKDSPTLAWKGNMNLIPASTQKLFTTWTAFETFGPEKTFATDLYITGEIQNGILKGDVIIKGNGDPSFASALLGKTWMADSVFSLWTEKLKQAGIKSVEGCVWADASYFDGEEPDAAGLWEDIGNYYGGLISGLCFRDNVYALELSSPIKVGAPINLISSKPNYTGIGRFDNQLFAGEANTGDSAYIYGYGLKTVRYLKGTYPAGRERFILKGTLPSPAWTCAMEWKLYLQTHGILIQQKPNSKPQLGKPSYSSCSDTVIEKLPELSTSFKNWKWIDSHKSPELTIILRHIHDKSDNNYAQQLCAVLGKEIKHKGNAVGCLEALQSSLAKKNLDLNEIHFRDGNGLSRYNWISPRQMTQFLVLASRHPKFLEYRSTLIGEENNPKKLERYGKNWSGSLWIKTGTLQGVYGLTGYLIPKSGHLQAFSILINHFNNSKMDMDSRVGELLNRWRENY